MAEGLLLEGVVTVEARPVKSKELNPSPLCCLEPSGSRAIAQRGRTRAAC